MNDEVSLPVPVGFYLVTPNRGGFLSNKKKRICCISFKSVFKKLIYNSFIV